MYFDLNSASNFYLLINNYETISVNFRPPPRVNLIHVISKCLDNPIYLFGAINSAILRRLFKSSHAYVHKSVCTQDKQFHRKTRRAAATGVVDEEKERMRMEQDAWTLVSEGWNIPKDGTSKRLTGLSDNPITARS